MPKTVRIRERLLARMGIAITKDILSIGMRRSPTAVLFLSLRMFLIVLFWWALQRTIVLRSRFGWAPQWIIREIGVGWMGENLGIVFMSNVHPYNNRATLFSLHAFFRNSSSCGQFRLKIRFFDLLAPGKIRNKVFLFSRLFYLFSRL